MAFTATITNIVRSEKSIEIEVDYLDSNTKFSTRRVFSFDDPANMGYTEMENIIISEGQKYKNAISSHSTLKNKVGVVITI